MKKLCLLCNHCTLQMQCRQNFKRSETRRFTFCLPAVGKRNCLLEFCMFTAEPSENPPRPCASKRVEPQFLNPNSPVPGEGFTPSLPLLWRTPPSYSGKSVGLPKILAKSVPFYNQNRGRARIWSPLRRLGKGLPRLKGGTSPWPRNRGASGRWTALFRLPTDFLSNFFSINFQFAF